MVYEYCRWLRTQYARLYFSDGPQVRPAMREVVFDRYLSGVTHFLPSWWSHRFLKLLHKDIDAWCAGKTTCLDYADPGNPHTLTKDVDQITLVRLQYCIDTLCMRMVQLLHSDDAFERRAARSPELARHAEREWKGTQSAKLAARHVEWEECIFNPPLGDSDVAGAATRPQRSVASSSAHSASNGASGLDEQKDVASTDSEGVSGDTAMSDVCTEKKHKER